MPLNLIRSIGENEMLKEKMKKVSENIYELPKSGKMLVEGRIFTSDKLFEAVEEICVQQLVNVASLPGILGHASAMPDVHVGYGFPIGGVAAFDLEKGVISPGGVGYDINCLHPSTRIISQYGYYKKIGEFSSAFDNSNLFVCDLETKSRQNAKPLTFMRKDADRKILKIRTET